MHSQICTAGGFGRVPEATLFLRAQMGCRESLNTLMARHDGLVHAVVRRQVLGDLPFAEALQAGRIGLWRAIQGYDPFRGTAFSTYAWPCIMRQVWRAVKAHQREQKCTASQELLWFPQVSEDPFHRLEREAIYQVLHTLVRRLPPRLRILMIARYGLGGSPPPHLPPTGSPAGSERRTSPSTPHRSSGLAAPPSPLPELAQPAGTPHPRRLSAGRYPGPAVATSTGRAT